VRNRDRENSGGGSEGCEMTMQIAKIIEDMKGIIAALDPEGKIKVTRTEALEWWDKARIANKKYIREEGR